MKIFKLTIIIMIICCYSTNSSAAEESLQECLVIGQQADPARGRNLFRSALELWHRGRRTEATDIYEQAIIADHSILKHEDHGLAMKLLEKYRNKPEPLTVGELCRRGFFENILIGNLENSISFYEEAASKAENKEAELARDEADRLKSQLSYIRTWQQGIQRENRVKRNQDLQEYLERSKRADFEREYEDNSYEIEEIQERIAFLQNQEKEVMDEMYSSMRSAGRYRRRYYYPGSIQETTVDPSGAISTGNNTGADAALNLSQVSNPYSSQDSGNTINRDTSLNRFYIYRNRAKRQQDQLDQIRAEISGLNRRLAEMEKKGRELREKISSDPIVP